MFLGEALEFSIKALKANPVRSLLTALGMVIGTASVILVVTISLTSRDYILEQIEGVGSNMVFAYYEAGNQSATQADADFVKMADVDAIRERLADRIVAATGIATDFDRMLIAGKEHDVRVHGLRSGLQNRPQPGRHFRPLPGPQRRGIAPKGGPAYR